MLPYSPNAREEPLSTDSSALIDAWYRRFGTASVTVRQVLAAAIRDDDALFNALDIVNPNYLAAPHPSGLSRWLRDRENTPLTDSSGQQLHFTKGSPTEWRLLPFRARATAA